MLIYLVCQSVARYSGVETVAGSRTDREPGKPPGTGSETWDAGGEVRIDYAGERRTRHRRPAPGPPTSRRSAGALGGFEAVGLQVAAADPLDGAGVGGLQDDRRRRAGFESLGPAGGAQAPAVAGL